MVAFETIVTGAGEFELRREGRAIGAGHAVRGPGSAVFLKRTVIGRVPITRHVDRQSSLFEGRDVVVEYREDLVALRHRQRASWQKVVLHIDDDKRITFRSAQSWFVRGHSL